MKDVPVVGVSACLVGRPVRYDGGHRAHSWVLDDLRLWATIVEICPEDGAGLGTPRPPMQLVQGERGERLVQIESRKDCTEVLSQFAEAIVQNPACRQLSGFVLKSRSPSCGIRAPVLTEGGLQMGHADGIFVQVLKRRFPNLPLVEESNLDDKEQVQKFRQAVFDYHQQRTQIRKQDR